MVFTWTEFKTILTAYPGMLNYVEKADQSTHWYFASIPGTSHESVILKDSGADQTDFEANYLTKGNLPPLTFRNTSVTNTAIAVSSVPANIRGWNIINPNPGYVYLKIYNISGTVTVGTSAVSMTLQLQPGTTLFMMESLRPFKHFDTAIKIAVTNLQADNDNTAPTLSVHVALF